MRPLATLSNSPDILASLKSTLLCVVDHHNMTKARHLRSVTYRNEPTLAPGYLHRPPLVDTARL